MSDQSTPSDTPPAEAPNSDAAQSDTLAASPGPSRKVFWAVVACLAISLGVNAATFGFIAGRGHHGGGPGAGPGGSHGGGAVGGQSGMLNPGFGPGDLRRAARQMEKPDRDILKAAFEDRRGEMMGLRRGFKPLIQEVRKALAAEPYDPQALTDAFTRIRAQGAEVGDLFQAAVEDAAVNLSPEGRQALAKFRRDRR